MSSERPGLIDRVGQGFVNFAGRFMPDPFIFAILLSFVILGVTLVATPHSFPELVGFWGDGFWGFLPFSMQMCLILVTGYALAQAPPVRRLLDLMVDLPKSRTQAVVMVAMGACVTAWLNWGFGLIIGALLARDVGLSCKRRGISVHFPLLAAGGYAGLTVWHGGISGSAPLTVADSGHFLEEAIGVLPFSTTVLSYWNLILTLVLWVAIPATLVLFHPKEGVEDIQLEPSPPPEKAAPATPAERLEHSPIIVVLLVLMAVIWWLVKRPTLGINAVNFAFLFLGLALHGSAKAYADALAEGCSGVAGIVLQFPFYAGLMGLMKSSGLIASISAGFVGVSHTVQEATGLQLFYVLIFLSAGLVNMFVPSGGGQWGVQGPIAMDACNNLGLDPSVAVMAVSYGDQWTNMLQPFWALPLLAITGLKARDLIGYTIPIFITCGIIFSTFLLLAPFLS